MSNQDRSKSGRRIRVASAIASLTLLLGCSSGPKSQDDSFLAKFNGGTYENQSAIGFIPIGKRRTTRNVQGQVKCNPGLDQVPINHAQVDLYCDGKLIESTFTDRDGVFSFAFDFNAGHIYEVNIFASKWQSRNKLIPEARSIASTPQNLIFIDCTKR